MMMEQISAAESIVRVLQKVKAVGKDSRNQQQNFNYRGIDAVVNAVHPALVEVGGFIVPRAVSQDIEHTQTAKGYPMVVVRLRAQYAWYGTDGGDPIVGEVTSEAFDTADKATAKAWSVAFRTYLLQTLMLPTDDPDPDSQYLERGKPVEAPREWRARVAGAATLAELTAIFNEAQATGWLTQEVTQALTARKKDLQDENA